MADILGGATQCQFCAGIHERVRDLPAHQQPCPRIKRIEFFESGWPSAVEFWDNASGWDEDVVFPRQLMEEDDDAPQDAV